MASIVIVHGVGNQYPGKYTLHSSVAPALLDGVRLADGPPLKPDDVEVAFYGHRFRPPGTTSAKGEPAGAGPGARAGPDGHRRGTEPATTTRQARWSRTPRTRPTSGRAPRPVPLTGPVNSRQPFGPYPQRET